MEMQSLLITWSQDKEEESTQKYIKGSIIKIWGNTKKKIETIDF